MVTSGLSANEIYCLSKKGLYPSDICIGNSVYSLGFLGGFTSNVRMFLGGEVSQLTTLFQEGRRLGFERMVNESKKNNNIGITGVTNELIFHLENIEFLSVGSSVRSDNTNIEFFSTSSSGQELYSQIDSNYVPKSFVFGNVAYSIGVGKGLVGNLKSFVRGEVKEYTEVFTKTRNLALERIVNEAKQFNANSVVGLNTSILSLENNIGIQEMVMVGTASYNSYLPQEFINNPISGNLSSEEIWNITNMGYIPLKLMLGTSIYSLGIRGGITSALKSLVKGEISELTTLIYDARESSLQKIRDEASSIGADDVINVKTYIYDLGSGLLEFLAIGTAIKKYQGVKTFSDTLLTQAVTYNRNTFIDNTRLGFQFRV